jgi:hypothetical protein
MTEYLLKAIRNYSWDKKPRTNKTLIPAKQCFSAFPSGKLKIFTAGLA